jgi:hypothetical protein
MGTTTQQRFTIMIKPYRIQRPIRDLQSLQQEKRNLKAHIARNDAALKYRIQNLPAVAALRTVQQVGSFMVQTSGGKVLASLLGSGIRGKSFWKNILKTAALFAGTEIVKRFAGNRFAEEEGESDEETDTTTASKSQSMPDLSE